MSVIIGIQNKSPYPLPAYQSAGASGLDVYAHLEKPVRLSSLERRLIPTGLFLEMPEGVEAQIRPRSGLAMKYGITCLNTPGTIDADYRGEVQVMLVNLSAAPYELLPGDRIAQLVFASVLKIDWAPKETLSRTERAEGGWGHTGR